MNDQYRNGDVERRIENLLRIGAVHSVDYGAARIRVETGDLVTDWIPWITARAGRDAEWWAPEVGEQVMVLAPGGILEDAVALGAVYQDAYPAPAARPGVHVTRYQDGTTVQYDRDAHQLTIDCKGAVMLSADGPVDVQANGNATVQSSGTAAITAGGSVVISGAGVSITDSGGGGCSMSGNFRLQGDLEVDGNIQATGDIRSGGTITDADGDGGA